MRILKTSIALVVTSTLLFSCQKDHIHASGHIISEERYVPTFGNVDIQGLIKTNIHYGPTWKVVVRTDAAAMPQVVTVVSNNTLLLRVNDEYSFHHIDFEVDVTMPTIGRLTHEGVSCSSLSGFHGLDALEVVHTGVGQLQLSGTAGQLSIFHDGVGELNAYGFNVDTCHVDLSGVGNVKVTVGDLLEGSLTGVGNIYYHGQPAVNVYDSGVGHVIHVD